MSAAQAFAAVEAANAEWVISRAALSAAMQVKVLVTDVLPLQCARRRSLQKRRPFRGRMYLEHDADRVNDFLVSVGVARTQIWPVQFCARGRDFRGLSSFFCNSKTPLHGPASINQEPPSQRAGLHRRRQDDGHV
jgi:hypothetical protein